MKKRTATPKAWDMRAKLQALVERGINGERDAAKLKLARLESRVDFTGKDTRGPDIFAGVYHKATTAEPLAEIQPSGFEVMSFVKWAVETRTGVRCLFRDGRLWGQVTRKGAGKLSVLVADVSGSFVKLWEQFSSAPGVSVADRSHFYRGLFDGCLGDERDGPLPTRICEPVKVRRAKKNAVAAPCRLNVHPYTLAIELGKGIRCCVPLGSLIEELNIKITKTITL